MHPTRTVTSWAFSTPFTMYTDPPTFDFVHCKEGELTHQKDKYKKVPLPQVLGYFVVVVGYTLKSGKHFRLLFQKAAEETFRSRTKIVFALKHVKHFSGRPQGLK